MTVSHRDPSFFRTLAWRTTRAAVLRRDGYRCTCDGCERRAVAVVYILPRHIGGPDDPSNLRSRCRAHRRTGASL